LPLGFLGANSTAEVVVHPRLCADPWPRQHRSFAIDDVGRWLVVDNQDSDDVMTMRIGAADGALPPTAPRTRLRRPSFVGPWRGP
jgi:6-phosphogluconolactonase (cycloisomerase 2 family)